MDARRTGTAVALSLAAAMVWAGPTWSAPVEAFHDRAPQDEVVYFLLPDRFDNADAANDRGGVAGDRLAHGFDPTDAGFYNGGDLRGVTRRLDYIAGLGATAIWLGPIYRNKPVQGPPGHESAGYHGYWITDFTDVDPHFGTKADLKQLVDGAHARGLKVYLDIVTNHTADVIRYRECPASPCAYRSRADFPYSRRGGVDGPAINDGFEGDDAAHQTAANFARLTRPDYAYTPYVPAAEAHAKAPDWLNDPIYYHNRGDSTWVGESVTYGDFAGLDDLFTENPKVVQGFIDIYGRWIDEFGIDGFRIDTAKHVNPEFWRAFVPAMQARAKARGVASFHIFGEVYEADTAGLATVQREAGLPAVLDFAFQSAARGVIAGGQATSRLARLFHEDQLYEHGAQTAQQLPVFLGNHDMGRFGWFVRTANPGESDADDLRRVTLGYALAFFSRGQPVIYYGDEQGFAGSGGDRQSRQTMFASQVAAYNAERLIGTSRTTAVDNFSTDHPLYKALRELAAIRKANPALRRGDLVVRASSEGPGLLAFSRHAPGEKGETLVAFNTGLAPLTAQVSVDVGSIAWRSVHGACEAGAPAPGSYRLTIAPLDYVVCSTGTPQ